MTLPRLPATGPPPLLNPLTYSADAMCRHCSDRSVCASYCLMKMFVLDSNGLTRWHISVRGGITGWLGAQWWGRGGGGRGGDGCVRSWGTWGKGGELKEFPQLSSAGAGYEGRSSFSVVAKCCSNRKKMIWKIFGEKKIDEEIKVWWSSWRETKKLKRPPGAPGHVWVKEWQPAGWT